MNKLDFLFLITNIKGWSATIDSGSTKESVSVSRPVKKNIKYYSPFLVSILNVNNTGQLITDKILLSVSRCKLFLDLIFSDPSYAYRVFIPNIQFQALKNSSNLKKISKTKCKP